MSKDKVPKIKPKHAEKRPKEKPSRTKISAEAKINQQIHKELLPSFEIKKPVGDHIIAEFVQGITAKKISEDTIQFYAGDKVILKQLNADNPTIFIQE